jgi:CHAT domain-containing protein/tetratricopeptide (TPR) repeat protein
MLIYNGRKQTAFTEMMIPGHILGLHVIHGRAAGISRLAGHCKLWLFCLLALLVFFPYQSAAADQTVSAGGHALRAGADGLFSEAVKAFDEGRYGDVIKPGLSAQGAYRDLGDAEAEGRTLHYLGQARRRLADYAAALSLHKRALELAVGTGDRSGEGRALVDIGDVHERKKDLAAAAEYYKKAIAVLKGTDAWREASRAMRQLGDVYVATGNFGSAYEVYNQALQLSEKAHDHQAMAEYNDYLGFCHRRMGDYGTAIGHHRRALQAAEDISDADARLRARARALNHLGLCAAKQAGADIAEARRDQAAERYRVAISYEEEGLDAASRAGDRWRKGYILRALSLMHREMGALLKGAEAEKAFKRSLSRADEALALGVEMKEMEWQGLALHDRALALAMLGRRQDGLDALKRALALWERIGDLKSAGYARLFAARQFQEPEGRLAEAAASYAAAAVAFEKIGDSESEALAIMDRARIEALRGYKDYAAGLYEAGISRLEVARVKAGLPEFRKAFMGKVYDRYEEAALFALGEGLKERAFRYVEGMKARTFLDQLAEGRVEIEKGIDPDLRRKRDALEAALATASGNAAAEYRKPAPDSKALAGQRDEMDRLSMELDRVKKLIRMRNPLYASVQYPEPVSIAELQTRVLSGDEALLEYFITQKAVFCFVITRDGFEAVRLSVDAAILRADAEALIGNLESYPDRREAYDRATAARLYEALLKPFEGRISGKTLIIVPDGVLARLPFEPLVVSVGTGRSYLFERHAVKYIQSASVLALIRTDGGKAKTSDRFIGFGDPVYDYENFSRGKEEQAASLSGRGAIRTRYAELGGRLSRLESSGDEVRAIETIFRGENAGEKVRLRQEAREEYAKSEDMAGYGYIHFSMHGIVVPGFQAVAFSLIPGSTEDGLLTMGEIMNLRYNARLVALSACRSGLGSMERGEGITGLTRAVMYAGSPAAVVSLWSVDDTATRELMIKFYDNMIRKRIGKAEALRRTKQEMMATRYRNPYFWAAFVMYGE